MESIQQKIKFETEKPLRFEFKEPLFISNSLAESSHHLNYWGAINLKNAWFYHTSITVTEEQEFLTFRQWKIILHKVH